MFQNKCLFISKLDNVLLSCLNIFHFAFFGSRTPLVYIWSTQECVNPNVWLKIVLQYYFCSGKVSIRSKVFLVGDSFFLFCWCSRKCISDHSANWLRPHIVSGLKVQEEQRDLVHKRELSQPLLYDLPGLLLHHAVDVVPHVSEDQLLAEPVERPETIESNVKGGGTGDSQVWGVSCNKNTDWHYSLSVLTGSWSSVPISSESRS